jgi:ATP-binding cassette subfamily B protein RaxB
MQIVVDDVLLKKDENLLLIVAIGFTLLMLISVGTDVLRRFVVLNFTSRLTLQMSINLFRHLIRLPMPYFLSRHMGDIVSRFSSLESVRTMLTSGMVTAVVDGVMASLTLMAMFLYSWKLGSLVICVVVFYAIVRWIMYRPFRLLNEEVIVAAAKENSHFMESVRAIQTIKLFQKEGDRQHQWQNFLVNKMNKEIHISRWNIAYSTINSLLFGAENILVIYIAATAVMQEAMSLGMLYAFMSYKSRFVGSMDSLINQWIQFRMMDLHLNRLADIVHTETEDIDTQLSRELRVSALQSSKSHLISGADSQNKTIAGRIEVVNLSYRYSEHEPYVFRQVNFVIEAGETVAIVGPSGCGKTTLLKCLMGLIKPTEGEVLVDGKSLDNLFHYRSQIASVMQDDQLMAGDIAENIACFASSVDTKKVRACAHIACIDNDIEKLSMGYQTLVGDMGSSLSGGQKQRIILARALYRRPEILFMDEATSHLDEATESSVNANLGRMSITRVIVAHRAKTIASADRLMDDWYIPALR